MPMRTGWVASSVRVQGVENGGTGRVTMPGSPSSSATGSSITEWISSSV